MVGWMSKKKLVAPCYLHCEVACRLSETGLCSPLSLSALTPIKNEQKMIGPDRVSRKYKMCQLTRGGRVYFLV